MMLMVMMRSESIFPYYSTCSSRTGNLIIMILNVFFAELSHRPDSDDQVELLLTDVFIPT